MEEVKDRIEHLLREKERNASRAEYFRQYQVKRQALKWSKCKRCGFTARKLSDVGCLECYARTFGRREWARIEEDMIEMYAGKDDPAHLQLRIYQESGTARTRKAIRQKVKEMGIRTLNHQDGYTPTQLAEITGLSRNTFVKLIQRGTVENIARGRRRLIPKEVGDELIARYTKPETPSYSVQDVMVLLGYTETGVRKAVTRGLPSWVEGGSRRVCKATVDRAAEHLKDTGKLRVRWGLLAP